MSERLVGRIAVVTGGSRGIGRAIVEAFLAEGADVMTCGRGPRPGDLAEVVGWVTADVSDPAAVSTLRSETEARFGPATILVNNAGVQFEKTLVDTTDDDFDLLMGVNARGVFNCTREFIPAMETAGGGAITNLGSIAGNVADRSLALYSASKGFVHALTRAIAVDHGPAVRCNAICPGWIITTMADEAFGLAGDVKAARQHAERLHPAGRFGATDDVARAAVWLASDEASFVTGQCLTVDGGLTAQSPIQPTLC